MKGYVSSSLVLIKKCPYLHANNLSKFLVMDKNVGLCLYKNRYTFLLHVLYPLNLFAEFLAQIMLLQNLTVLFSVQAMTGLVMIIGQVF